MLEKRIIYLTNDGNISIIIPADCGLTIEEIAQKDVPAGIPYKITDVSDIPSDRTFRGAWDADFSEPDGYGIGVDAWFELQNAIKENGL